NPRLVECYFIKGRCYYKLDQPEDAYSLYQDAINLGFNNTSVYNAHGEALLAMKRYIDALNTFNSVIEIVGDTKEEIACAYCGSGIALHALGRTEEALQFFEKANELDPMIYSKPQYRYTIQ